MKCQCLYLGSPYKDSWFEVDQWVIKIMNALGVAVPLALGENQWRCSYVRYKTESEQVSSDQLVDSQGGKTFCFDAPWMWLRALQWARYIASSLEASSRFRIGDFRNLGGFS
jgi:hypothetical protein